MNTGDTAPVAADAVPSDGEAPSSVFDEDTVAALAALDDLADRPIAEHVTAFERVHEQLADTLASVDET